MQYRKLGSSELPVVEIGLGTMTWDEQNSEVLLHEPLAFVRSRRVTATTIIGANSMAQLQRKLDSVEVTLDQAPVSAIGNIHLRHPNPAW